MADEPTGNLDATAGGVIDLFQRLVEQGKTVLLVTHDPAISARAGVPLLVHENFRWQTPIRRLKQTLDEGRMGRIFRGRIQYANSFPVFDNQPFLRELEQFILTDMGTHVLDVARFLFGEAKTLFCRTHRVHRDIRGEDVATVVLGMADGATVACEISYATRMEHERFPETFVFVEGEQGSAELGPDYWIRVTTAEGTQARRHPPPRYAWADPAYDVVHASIVPCHADLLAALRGEKIAETSAEDNLKTLELVFAAYRSAETGQVVRLTSLSQDPSPPAPLPADRCAVPGRGEDVLG